MLEDIRKQQKLTKQEMQKRLGISKSYYSMLIRGLRPISLSLALRLNKEFGIALETIFFEKSVHRRTTRTG